MDAAISSLESARITALPAAAYYIPRFISEAEEESIITEINKLPSSRWTVLTHRRLLSLPSQLTGNAKDTLIASLLPKFLDVPILPRLAPLKVFTKSPHTAPNHCLVNEYQSGEGIMPHTDGPAYWPVTATVSLGGHTVLDIYEKNDEGERRSEPTWRILQEPGSLLITTGDLYRDTLHGIAETKIDQDLDQEHIVNWRLLGDQAGFEGGQKARGTRLSLTYRDVLKVAKLGGAMKFMSKR